MSKEHKNFCLNFNNEEKIVSIELTENIGILLVAQAFSKWLTENDIKHIVLEKKISEHENI